MKASSVILDALKDMDNTGTLEAEKKMDLYAGKDIRMTADTHREENGQGHTTAISKRGAASVTGKESSLTMTAGKDIHLQAARISSAGDMTIAGKRQVELGTAVAEKDNRVTWDRSNDRRDSTAMETGSTLTAGRNLTVENGKEITDLEEHHRHKERNLLSSTTTTTHDEVHAVKAQKSIIEGNTVSIEGGKDISLTGSAVASTKDIESKDNTYRGKEEHEYKKSGLTVSLGGAVITAKDNIIRPIKNAGQARDGLLGKLYAADAGFNLHDAAKTYKNIGDVKKGLTLDVSLGTQSAKSDSRYQGTEARESRIVSQGNIRIKSDENIAVKGSQITGENVTLQAGKDISLTAAENRKTTEGNSRSKGAGITASFGIGGLQNVGISAGKSKGNMEEEIITHTGSAVTAKETLAMESGKDIDIKGSKAGGKKVEVKTGNNLSIESLQDSHTYHSRDKESGIHLQRDITVRQHRQKRTNSPPVL